MRYRYEELAKMIDHALLHPTLSDREMEEGCRLAAEYGTATVCVKPYAVSRAAELLAHTDVLVSCVAGFPHGNSTTEAKRHETMLACRDGAREIDMVLNLGKAMSGDWPWVERDVKTICEEAHGHGAKVKVIFGNDYLAKGGAGLSGDDFKRRLAQLCERAGADWIKTSTGFDFVKQADGRFECLGATEHDVALMRASVSARVQVKAAGGVRTLEALVRVRDLGATRCGTSATAALLGEYRRREAQEKAGQAPEAQSAALGAGGY
jgi:deoxyribose-phosphate aldolase